MHQTLTFIIYFFSKLTNIAQSKQGFDIRREPGKALKQIEKIGHMAAHSKLTNARKSDIEPYLLGIRQLTETLVNLGGGS